MRPKSPRVVVSHDFTSTDGVLSANAKSRSEGHLNDTSGDVSETSSQFLSAQLGKLTNM